LVRAVAENPRTFRFASTAPFYVEVGDAKRRVSKSAAKFFLEWVKERAERVKLDDAQQREEVLKYHTQAEEFWKGLLERSNAEGPLRVGRSSNEPQPDLSCSPFPSARSMRRTTPGGSVRTDAASSRPPRCHVRSRSKCLAATEDQRGAAAATRSAASSRGWR